MPRVAHVGRGPEEQVGLVAAADGRGEFRVRRDRRVGSEDGAVELVEPLRGRIDDDLRSSAESAP